MTNTNSTASINSGSDNGTVRGANHGGNLKTYLRNERLERIFAGKTRQRVLLPKSMVRSQSFMDRFFAETGWHWLDVVAETRAAERACA